MTPIEKNIIVVDDHGNEYEATYPKRAKGLVKNGRARFISNNKICLACPPNIILEDKKMIDNVSQNINENIDTTVITPKDKYSLEYALEQIDKILASTSYLDSVISELLHMNPPDGVGDIANQAKAQALAEVVRCREATNQQLLAFYMKMVDDLKNKYVSKNNTVSSLEEISKWLKSQNRDEYDEQAWLAMLEAVKGQMSRNY